MLTLTEAPSQIDDWNIKGDDIEIAYYIKGNDWPPFISIDKDAFDKWINANDKNWVEGRTKCYQEMFEDYSKDMDFMRTELAEYLQETFYSKILKP